VTPAAAGRLEGPIGRVGIVLRDRGPEVLPVLERLEAWLGARSIDVAVEEDHEGPAATGGIGLDIAGASYDLLVTLGGDGTLLRAARAVVGVGTPVLGVNLGRLGFLTAFPDSDLETGLTHVFEGRARLEPRFTLRGRIERAGEVQGDNFFALNDIVIHTSGAARVVPLTLHVGEGAQREEVGSFAADGVILATPTGSTAYSMSAGGPIIVPSVECIVVTPICPHSLAVRPMVVPAYEVLSVTSRDPDTQHQVTVDGQVERSLGAAETVVVAREELPVSLVRLPGQSFFATMRRKLNWAALPPERA
jgi:NAD+ kinase